MKLTAKINPKNLFRSKKRTTVISRSEATSSFNSSITPSSASPESSCRNSKSTGIATPTSVLSIHSREISSDESSDSPESTRRNSKSAGIETPTNVLPIHSDEITADVEYELTQAFRIIDADGDGRITRSELEALLRRIGGAEPIPPEELTLMINEIDRDGDGSISLEEFGVIRSAFGPPLCDDEIRGAFEFFDTDRDGMITAEELFEVFKTIVGDGDGNGDGNGRCTLEDCRRMISSVDKNGDGFVCFEDFARMMEQQR